ncbi:MAG: hypothetical protein N3B01_10375 [Verrucomicrobiae bacterium]|nr:hypothetical protein [Verrucomicrobiae bacterium]
MIRFDKLTIKAQEALQSAHELAQKQHHSEVDCEHLLAALIQQPEGLVRPLLEKLGLSPDAILRKLDVTSRVQAAVIAFSRGMA